MFDSQSISRDRMVESQINRNIVKAKYAFVVLVPVIRKQRITRSTRITIATAVAVQWGGSTRSLRGRDQCSGKRTAEWLMLLDRDQYQFSPHLL